MTSTERLWARRNQRNAQRRLQERLQRAMLEHSAPVTTARIIGAPAPWPDHEPGCRCYKCR